MLNVVLIASVLLTVGTVGFAIAMPNDGESFTKFYHLTATDDGDTWPSTPADTANRYEADGVGTGDWQNFDT